MANAKQMLIIKKKKPKNKQQPDLETLNLAIVFIFTLK